VPRPTVTSLLSLVGASCTSYGCLHRLTVRSGWGKLYRKAECLVPRRSVAFFLAFCTGVTLCLLEHSSQPCTAVYHTHPPRAKVLQPTVGRVLFALSHTRLLGVRVATEHTHTTSACLPRGCDYKPCEPLRFEGDLLDVTLCLPLSVPYTDRAKSKGRVQLFRTHSNTEREVRTFCCTVSRKSEECCATSWGSPTLSFSGVKVPLPCVYVSVASLSFRTDRCAHSL